jgi:hypothetical protein
MITSDSIDQADGQWYDPSIIDDGSGEDIAFSYVQSSTIQTVDTKVRHVTKGDANIYEDLGFSKAQAAHLKEGDKQRLEWGFFPDDALLANTGVFGPDEIVDFGTSSVNK